MDLGSFVKQNKRPATDKQVEFAMAIADLLDLEYPDFKDFSATKEFIDENIDDYNDARQDAKENWSGYDY